MPVAAVPGNVRLRAFQLGLETTFKTPVNATRRFPWSYAPVVDPHWTWPTADTGTLDEAINPYRLRQDTTGTATGSLAYNDAPYLWAALTKSGVTPSSNVWTFTPASTSQDNFEIFSGEWGDETADQYGFTSGVLDRLQLTYPEDQSPVQISADWRFAASRYPITRQALSVDFQPTWVYAADTSVYIDSVAGSIGTTVLANTAHGLTVDIQNNLDVKSFLQGSNTRFQVDGYGRGLRTNTTTFSFAKTTQALQEVADWLNASPVERFLAVDTVAPDIVTGAIHYAHKVRFAGYWFTNTLNATYGTTNTVNQLVCQGFLDQTLTYPFQAIVTCGLSSL
jgi:hypothetical protein